MKRQLSMDISNLDPKLNHDVFLSEFKKYRSELENIYADYPNKDKLIYSIEYWIFNIFCIQKAYGKSGLKSFLNGSLSNPLRFSYLYEFSDLSRGTEIKSNKDNNFFYFFLNFFVNKIYIPGAALDNYINKFINRVSFIFIHSIPLIKNQKLENKLKNLFGALFANEFSKDEIILINKKLPKVYYSNKVKNYFKKSLNVVGSPASFLEYSGYEKLFLLDNRLDITGNAHGGGYGIYKINYFEYYEKKLCKKFYGWGFSEENKPQRRFNKIKTNKNAITRILWIEDSIIPTLDFFSLPFQYYQSINKTSKLYIFNELNNSDIKYSNLSHPVKSSLYEGLRRDDYNLMETASRSEELIEKSDILIFDNSAATLMHFAIENEISFYQIISRFDFENFSDLQKEFFLILHKYDFGIFNDEDNKLSNSISKNKLNSNYRLPNELIDFYDNNFK
mgnify:CR=1 FL=1